jgi:hypothetical protein
VTGTAVANTAIHLPPWLSVSFKNRGLKRGETLGLKADHFTKHWLVPVVFLTTGLIQDIPLLTGFADHKFCRDLPSLTLRSRTAASIFTENVALELCPQIPEGGDETDARKSDRETGIHSWVPSLSSSADDSGTILVCWLPILDGHTGFRDLGPELGGRYLIAEAMRNVYKPAWWCSKMLCLQSIKRAETSTERKLSFDSFHILSADETGITT